MALETSGPIKGLTSFFTENYSEMAKTINGLTPEVIKIYKFRESNFTATEIQIDTTESAQEESVENFEEDTDTPSANVPNTPTQFPPTKTQDIQLTLKLDPDQPNDDKGNLDDLGFEEDTCEVV